MNFNYITGLCGARSGQKDSFLFQINSARRKASKERESSESFFLPWTYLKEIQLHPHTDKKSLPSLSKKSRALMYAVPNIAIAKCSQQIHPSQGPEVNHEMVQK